MTQIKEFTTNTVNSRLQTAAQEPVLHLSPAEELLRQLLLACCDSIVSSKNDVTNLDMWFVGGWVRDRLLDRQSSDIDVALSSMTGIQFGHALENYLQREKHKYIEEARRRRVPTVISKLHEIKRNSKKSKHLETASFHSIFGLSVDFVNLRKETYSEDSRIPQMEFGTPAEDAHRRDATINALFYNLKTGIIEDHTELGLHDLAAGVIRTPSSPFEVFDDDPLRILRLIRIATQLGFRIERETVQAIRSAERPEQLCTKVSRERVETELLKILKCPNTLSAFQLIHELYLYNAVFLRGLPYSEDEDASWVLQQSGPYGSWHTEWARAFETVAFLLSGGPKTLRNILLQHEKMDDIWMLTAFHYMGEATADGSFPRKLPRSALGLLIRCCGSTWRLQVLYALLKDDAREMRYGNAKLALITRWSRFVEHIIEQKLEDAPCVKPILNGYNLMELFKLEKGGPFMQEALNDLLEWQFNHENATEEEAMEWMLTQRENYHV
ncbi:putative CCA tRNA nucleotidyltransferase 1 [Aspergillus udagawae]|uniref:Putative CCA tRNA nucleotidyltransferase 1 n=1 Tax=Aspergillus udagawae TaxID=91492 RepID=A0A8H3SFH8_9EURO|nr:putative CCA tRNA nucleotidyltransferase 1 [Aspergillus udagawae]